MTAYATLGREAQEGFYQTSQWFKEDQRVITVKMWGVGGRETVLSVKQKRSLKTTPSISLTIKDHFNKKLPDLNKNPLTTTLASKQSNNHFLTIIILPQGKFLLSPGLRRQHRCII